MVAKGGEPAVWPGSSTRSGGSVLTSVVFTADQKRARCVPPERKQVSPAVEAAQATGCVGSTKAFRNEAAKIPATCGTHRRHWIANWREGDELEQQDHENDETIHRLFDPEILLPE